MLEGFSLVIGLNCGHHRCCIDTLFLYQLEQLLHLIHIQIMFFILCSNTCHVTIKHNSTCMFYSK